MHPQNSLIITKKQLYGLDLMYGTVYLPKVSSVIKDDFEHLTVLLEWQKA